MLSFKLFLGIKIHYFQYEQNKIIAILSTCTVEFSLETLEWHKLNRDIEEIGPGGDIIRGSDDKIYYIGGIDSISGQKSKAIYEFDGKSWHKWDNELIIPEEALDAWGVMELGHDYCTNKTNVTKAISHEEGWLMNKPDPKSGICIKNLFEGKGTHNQC